MDAYDIKNKIAELWQKLCVWPDAANIKKQYTAVPVYVKINNKLVKVTGVTEQDNKIILDTDNEQSTI
jgi:hypothetical protein